MIKDINNIDPKLLEEDDRIVAYLKGQMTVEEEQQFMKDLEDNPDLKEKAIVTARLVKGLKQVGKDTDKTIREVFLESSEDSIESVAKQTIHASNDALVERAYRMEKATIHLVTVLGINIPENANQMEAATIILERFATDFEQERSVSTMMSIRENDELRKSAADSVITPDFNISIPKRKKKPPMRRVYSWLAIAASLAGIFWLGIGYNNYRHTTRLGEEFVNSAFSTVLISRGSTKGADTSSNAERKLEQLFTDVKENKNIDNAIHELSLYWEISQMETYNDYTDYSAEIGWSLAIAHLKDNDKKNARKVLEKLLDTSEEDSAVNQKAKELLGKLK